jgi:hypothetical protein
LESAIALLWRTSYPTSGSWMIRESGRHGAWNRARY